MPNKIHSKQPYCGTALAVLLLAAGLLLLLSLAGVQLARFFSLRQTLKAAAASRNWPTVEGRILTSGIRERRVSSKHRITRESEFILDYDYTVNGRSCSGSRIYFGYGPDAEKKTTADLAGDYPVGKTVVVHYHPAHPEICTLETGQSLRLRQQYYRAKNLLWAGVAAIIIVGTIAVLAWRRWRQLQNQP